MSNKAQTAADVCPKCKSAAHQIVEAERGLFRCGSCNTTLVKISRQNHLGWAQEIFIDPNRPGVTVHGDPAGRAEGAPPKEL